MNRLGHVQRAVDENRRTLWIGLDRLSALLNVLNLLPSGAGWGTGDHRGSKIAAHRGVGADVLFAACSASLVPARWPAVPGTGI